MKKLLIILALLSAGLISAQAPENEEEEKERRRSRDSRNRLHLGIKLGSNLSNVYDETTSSYQTYSKYGFAGGGFADIPLGKYFGIHPEVLYSQKGFKARKQDMGTSYDLIRTTSYVDVPLLFALKPVRPITLMAGPQYAYLINQTDIYLDGANSGLQSQEFKNEDPLRKNILGAVVGVDVNIWNLVVSGRYGFDLLSNYSDGSSGALRYKNVWLQGTIGFRIF
ncbi:MAG: hypothetical protein K0S32_921 [Bacteroidetes bacterium]|jgi:hypothetical protein|nr:hypothetical protein [Bacteroidota bacterium]